MPKKRQSENLFDMIRQIEDEIAASGAKMSANLLSSLEDLAARSEKARQDSETKYLGLFDNTVEGIFQMDADGEYLTVNRALAALLGYGSADALMKGIRKVRQL